MSAEQTLVGAMGCASWRSHERVSEHAALAPAGATIRGRASPGIGPVAVLGLNEVGVTDLVMAALWRFGPHAAAYAVSPSSEANHLGADIAILHPASLRLVLYQSKLARYNSGEYLLKSRLTASQTRLLGRRSVDLGGTRFRVTGRLALYQGDLTPFIGLCPHPRPHSILELWAAHNSAAPAPEVGRWYYEQVLAGCGCSPSGVLAAPVSRSARGITSVDASTTWPWEFDLYEWFRGNSPLDGGTNGPDERLERGGYAPDFGRYIPTAGEAATSENAAALAQELAQRLRLPVSQRLYLIVLN